MPFISLEIKVSYFRREKPYACSNLMSCATGYNRIVFRNPLHTPLTESPNLCAKYLIPSKIRKPGNILCLCVVPPSYVEPKLEAMVLMNWHGSRHLLAARNNNRSLRSLFYHFMFRVFGLWTDPPSWASMRETDSCVTAMDSYINSQALYGNRKSNFEEWPLFLAISDSRTFLVFLRSRFTKTLRFDYVREENKHDDNG